MGTTSKLAEAVSSYNLRVTHHPGQGSAMASDGLSCVEGA